MEQNTSSHEKYKIAQPAPLWIPKDCERVDFITAMQYHAPFIHTSDPDQTDLGGCIIGTFPPHLVFKIHHFKLNPIRKTGSNNELNHCIEQEKKRLEYLRQRYQAIKNGQEARLKGKTVRDLICVDRNMKYDREFDEPRVVGKVPGVEVYLELIGCLDKVSLEELDWNGEKGVLWTMDYALSYALNFYRMDARRRLGSRKDLPQVMDSWKDEWSENLHPFHQPRNGLGYTNFDASRRPREEKY